MRRMLSMTTVLAMLVSVCAVEAASAATVGYGSDEVEADALVQIKNKEPKKVEFIRFAVKCYSPTFSDIPVKNDRFKGQKGKVSVVGKFSSNAKEINVTVSIDLKPECRFDAVLVRGNSNFRSSP